MTGKELSDNLTFLSALKLLEQLVERELLTTEEAEVTHRELARRLRPTLILGYYPVPFPLSICAGFPPVSYWLW